MLEKEKDGEKTTLNRTEMCLRKNNDKIMLITISRTHAAELHKQRLSHRITRAEMFLTYLAAIN